jgi:GGDEF domain-containing protein
VVDLRPTDEILSAVEAGEAEQETDVPTLVSRDEATGLRNSMSLREELRAAISRYDDDKEAFSLVGASIRGLSEATAEERDDLLLAFADSLRETIDESVSPAFRLEDDTFFLILPVTEEVRGVQIAKALFAACLKRDPTRLQLALAVVPFYRTWGPDRVLKAVSRALQLASSHPYPVCLVYKASRSTYEILDLLGDSDVE